MATTTSAASGIGREQRAIIPFPLVSLGEESLFRVESGGTPKSDVEEYWGGGIPWAKLVDLPATDFISANHRDDSGRFPRKDCANRRRR